MRFLKIVFLARETKSESEVLRDLGDDISSFTPILGHQQVGNGGWIEQSTDHHQTVFFLDYEAGISGTHWYILMTAWFKNSVNT